jgi:multiple sugar transport system permease protein
MSRRTGRTGRAEAERRLGWALTAPAVVVMLAVTAYPILYAIWLSLQRADLRFPGESGFVGLANYASVLSSPLWWQDLANTVGLMVASVAIELVLGMALAVVMHRALVARGAVRAAVLVPYGIITVVAALAWQFAFDSTTGFVNEWFGVETAWFSGRWTALFVILLAEVWKTTPFIALLLLGGLVLVPEDLLRAARVDGASPWTAFRRITLPLMKGPIMVAVLFRSLDAFRIFDSVFVMTRGSAGTETVSILGYNQLLNRLNLGIGSAVSVLIFLGVVLIAVVFVKGFGVSLERGR